MNYAIRAGNVTFDVRDGLADAVQRTLRNLDDNVLRRANAAADEVFEEARASWPVKTGRSRDGLERVTTVDVGEGTIRVSIRNTVEYAKYIKAKNLGGKSPFVELLRKPLVRVARDLARELVAVARSTVEG